MSKESILLAEKSSSSCVRKEAVDIEILITTRNDDRNIMESIRTLSGPTVPRE